MPLLVTLLVSRLFVTGFIGESHRGAMGLKIHQLFLTPHATKTACFYSDFNYYSNQGCL